MVSFPRDQNLVRFGKSSSTKNTFIAKYLYIKIIPLYFPFLFPSLIFSFLFHTDSPSHFFRLPLDPRRTYTMGNFFRILNSIFFTVTVVCVIAVYAGTDSQVVQCLPYPSSNKDLIFPPPKITSIEFNNYSYDMICGMAPVDPTDANYIAWFSPIHLLNIGPQHIQVSVAGGFIPGGPNGGYWRIPWPVQDGINMLMGGYDIGCYSSSSLLNYSMVVYTAYCSEGTFFL